MAEHREERIAVKTYVPAYQKEEWAEQAEELDMSLSEFLRSMVQAGRRGFGEEDEEAAEPDTPEQPDPTGSNPGGNGLETVVLGALREEPREFDELVDVVAGDLRRDLDALLEDLEDRGVVEHDRMEGGYAVIDGE